MMLIGACHMMMMAYLVLSQLLLLLATSAASLSSGVLPVLPPVVYATCVHRLPEHNQVPI
jgi:hypothetical protein